MVSRKATYILGGVVLLFILVMLFGFSKPSNDLSKATITEKPANPGLNDESNSVNINLEQSNFEFEGFGPGKSHVGTFSSWSGKIFFAKNKIVGIEGTINPSTVETGIDKLDTHLQSDDFFDVAQFPEIKFSSNSISNGKMTGILNFRGAEKEISFPITKTDSSIAAEFLLDTTPFNFKYTGINKEVKIKFDFVAES